MQVNAKMIVMAGSALVVILAGLAFYVLRHEQVDTAGMPSCPPLNISIDRTNSVHGLKDGKLFSYVDLNEFTPSLDCHPKDAIVDFLVPLVSVEVSEWWKESRLLSADTAEVHVINILNKDEYARANFGSAVKYGVIKFEKESGIVKLVSQDLNFE